MAVEETATHRPYCALQCGMLLRRDGAGGGPATAPGPSTRASGSHGPVPRLPTNRGGLCQKGWTSAEVLTHPDRLTTPLMRDQRTGPLQPISWEAGLARVAGEIARTRDAHGADAVALLGGGGLTNEKAYQLGKFARVAADTSNIDYNDCFYMSSAAAASMRAFGVDRGMPFPCDGASREPAPAPAPGTDLALAAGLAHIVIAEGYVDTSYITERLRVCHRTGQRPGRSRARAEGRPAPRLPPYRRPGHPGACRRGVGRSGGDAARLGQRDGTVPTPPNGAIRQGGRARRACSPGGSPPPMGGLASCR